MRTIYDLYDKKPIEQKNHILTISKEALEGEFRNDVNKLIGYLWKNPSIIITLLINSPNKEAQNKLIYIIMNTFYENIFSSNIIDETLLCIISILLKNEINQLKTKEDKVLFLNDTLCSNLLGELSRKPEITKYFRRIIEDVVKDINKKSNIVNSSISDLVVNNKINLNVNEIEEQINQKTAEKEKFEKLNKNRKHTNSFSVSENFFTMKFKDIDRLKSESNIEKINKHNFNMLKTENEKKNKINEDEEDEESFVKKYFDNITKDILLEKKNSIEDIKMKDYLQYQLDNLKNYENNNNINNNEGIYTNQTVLKNIYGSLLSSKVLTVYQKYFALVINSINKLLKNFLDNINELPFNIKQICKIIAILLYKKFPNLKIFERNSYIGIFILDKIFFPLFQDPKINCLVTKIDRNEDSYFNFNFIGSLLSDFSLGYFYLETEKNGNYTPFNGYFLEEMPILMEIYDKILEVEIPKYIEDLLDINENNDINEKLNSIKQKYFEIHKDESIYHQCCCLSFGDFDFIVKLVDSCKDILFENNKNHNILKNIIEKINKNTNYKELLSLKIKKEDDHPVMSIDKNTKDKKDHNLNYLIKPTVEYFIINHISFQEKYNYFTDINTKISYLNFNEIGKNNDLYLLFRKAICEVLYYIPSIKELIEIKEIKMESLNNFQLLIKDLHKYILLLTSMEPFSKSNLSIHFSINFLLENINIIEDKYKDNSYILFFEEIEKELNSLINTYNFNDLATWLNNECACKIRQELNEISLLKLKKIVTNSIVNRIINEFPVFIKIETRELITRTKENNKINVHTNLKLDIKRAKSKEKKKISDPKGIYINEKYNFKIYKTLDSFIKFFNIENDPKISQYINNPKENDNKMDIYDYMRNIDLPEKMISFINTSLKETISDMLYIEKINKIEIPSILLKTNKIIISGLYNTFSVYLPNKKDSELYLKTKLLSWTNINHFINDKYHLYDTIISFIVDCLKKFENKKNITGKIICIRKIKNILSNIQNISTIKYTNENKISNIYLNPLMIYSIIKSQLKYFASDIKFIEIFIDLDEKNKIENNDLIQELKSYINYILNINYNNLNGNLTLDEYNTLCNKSFSK